MVGKTSGDISIFEYIRLHPESTSGDIAAAVGRSVGAMSGAISQLHSTGRIVKTGARKGVPIYSVNTLPFGCSNPLLLTFNQLLGGVRSETV